MLERHISAVLILNDQGQLMGIVTEGDLLRRYESGTERKRSRWAEAFTDSSRLAAEYVKSHGRKAKDVMTRDVVAVAERTPLQKIADTFESRGIKQVAVTREERPIGIVSRANLLQALVSRASTADQPPADDRSIRARLLGELQKKPWRPSNLIVANGVVHYWGEVHSESEREAMRIAAENIPGVRGVEDHTQYPNVLPLP
jgi:signal-transduction protein with cAMP-binding, CBS, and nucleotidyltransferase domain